MKIVDEIHAHELALKPIAETLAGSGAVLEIITAKLQIIANYMYVSIYNRDSNLFSNAITCINLLIEVENMIKITCCLGTGLIPLLYAHMY